jgi:serine/threonine-protein kinase
MASFRFGRFVLDADTRRLTVGGTPVVLTRKVFDTLTLLVEARGQVVERDTFLKALWPDTVVEERNLTVNISTLRRVLGGYDSQEIVETLAKSGYRLVPRVTLLQDGSDVPTAAAVPAPPVTAPPAAGVSATWSYRALAATLVFLVVVVPGASSVLPIADDATEAARVADPAAEQRIALAVLPFVVSGGDAPEAFGVGLADAVIARLEAVPRITVKRLRDVAPYASSDSAAIGKAVGADSVIEGVVQRLAGSTRLRVHVIDVRSGHTRWTEEFVQPHSAAYEIRDLLAAGVSGTAMRHLIVERAWRRHPPPSNQEAMGAYLDARMHSNRVVAGGDIRDAIQAYERAVALDPAFAPAWSGLARMRRAWSFSTGADRDAEWRLAYEATHRAVELDPLWPEGHQMLGMLKYSEWEWEEAERHLRKAVELDPENDEAITWLANLLRGLARWDESIATYQRARNPISTTQVQQLGEVLWHAGRYMEALGMLAEATRLNPGNSAPHLLRAEVYDTIGKEAEAIAARQMATQLSGDRAYRESVLSAAPRGYRAVRQAELEYARGRNDWWGTAIGLTYFGRHEAALEALDRCITEKCMMSILIATEPRLEALRGYPKFRELAVRVNLAHLVP